MNPPDNAPALCIDEKTMIQALDRTQPGRPIKRGNAGTMTHDYKRNGTMTVVLVSGLHLTALTTLTKRVTELPLALQLADFPSGDGMPSGQGMGPLPPGGFHPPHGDADPLPVTREFPPR